MPLNSSLTVPRNNSTPGSPGGRNPLDSVLFLPRTRSFIVGSTGSGKSTLACTLLEAYSRRYPTHRLYLIDPKHRYIAIDLDEDEPLSLFPDGFKERNHGRRDGVSVVAEPLDKPRRPRDEETAFIVQDDVAIYDTFDWLYKHSDVRRPSLIFCDESFDSMRGVRADPSLRRIMQQGRELGIGAVIINQRPRWIDATFLSEAQFLFIGRVSIRKDREYLADVVNEEVFREEVEIPLPQYSWYRIDQEKETHIRFHLGGL